jgi:soluble lytic murein transglycosylase-like protein
MDDKDLDGLIIKTALNFRLDANLVRAIVEVESGGNPWKNRYESTWPQAYLITPRDYANKLIISLATETVNQMTSWGLMQLIGSVSRERGFQLDLPMLCQPDIGLFYGCKQLRWLADRIGDDESHLIASYNGGLKIARTAGGMFANEIYVDKVSAVLRKLREIK